jgi:hypothetical protein
VIDLDAALTDLAEHLDYPAGDDLVARVRAQINAPARSKRSPSRWLSVAAVILALLAALALAITPSRDAIARWLGVGAVEVRTSSTPPPTNPTATFGAPAVDVTAAQQKVSFPIRTAPAPLKRVAVDPSIPGGLVALTYDDFTIVEIATKFDEPPIAKTVAPGQRVEPVTVNGHEGFWIGNEHAIGFIDRHGDYRVDTVRRSGPVLVWADAAVTFRIEGLRTLAAAQELAASLR